MRLVAYILVVSALFLSALVSTALAGNAHFVKNLSSASLSGQSLVCAFKEAGLQSGAVESVTCSASESITYECVNGGTKNPSASNKRTFVTTGAASGQFTADQNGNIVGTLTIAPRSAASLGFSCPPGQTVTLFNVSYSGVQLSDATSGASLSLPGSFSFTDPNAPTPAS